MNLKFWRRVKQEETEGTERERRAELEAAGWRVKAKQLQAEIDSRISCHQELSTLNSQLSTRLAAVYQRTPEFVSERAKKHADAQRLLVLAGLSEEDPLWKVVLSYADEHARNERQVAFGPGLDDGQRQYNAGRGASAEDFCAALRDLRVMAVQQARES